MPDFLARVAKLHEAAIAAGLPGMLVGGYSIGSVQGFFGIHLYRGTPSTQLREVPDEAAQAACAWWIRSWCYIHGNDVKASALISPGYFIAWAEEIVAARKVIQSPTTTGDTP